MQKANVNVKIDANVKKLATQILDRMGIDQTTAIDIFYRQIITDKRFPFQPATAPDKSDNELFNLAMARKPKIIKLDTDNKGNILIDKKKHPEVYDWAVNG